MNRTSFKADIRMIIREPILLLFMVLPVFIFVVFKLLIKIGAPIIYTTLNITISNYYGYILTGVLLMTPSMLGTVAGFMMIDERDARISELISITPIGYRGYILNRLGIPFIGSVFYTIVAYYFLNIYYLNPFLLGYLSILLGLQGILIGFILYIIADDKVKGLTYAKGMSIFTVLAMADLIRIPWVIIIAGFTPFYWITRIVMDHNKALPIIVASVVHGIYLMITIRAIKKA